MPIASALIMMSQAGCATRIAAPVSVADPVNVYVADYGHHSSLVLPRGRDRLCEFAYGQWDWFVLNRDQWYRAVPTLLVPQKGALGTRTLPFSESVDSIRSVLFANEVISISVERSLAERLLTRLQRVFEEASDDPTFNPVNELQFIPDEPYSGRHQCNHRVNDWLRELGCTVNEGAAIAQFEVVQPAGRFPSQ